VVSIVTPSYNQADFLEETIRSVLDQDYPRIQYVVVDDGSTDVSPDIAERYADRLHWWTRQENAGKVAAINRGFEHTDGDVMAYLNSDDTLLPGAVAAAVAELTGDPELVLVYGDSRVVDAGGREVEYLAARPYDRPSMVRAADNHVPQPSAFWTRRAWEQAGPFDPRGFYFFDFEFFLRVGSVGKVKTIAAPLSTYRLHPDSKTVAAGAGKAADYVRFADSFLASERLPPELRAFAREGRARSYAAAGDYLYWDLQLGRARRLLWRSLAMAPRHATRRSLSLALKSLLPKPVVRRLRERRHRGAHRD
jgi:glycosyltransferase involved in cell wall biosynthesis